PCAGFCFSCLSFVSFVPLCWVRLAFHTLGDCSTIPPGSGMRLAVPPLAHGRVTMSRTAWICVALWALVSVGGTAQEPARPAPPLKLAPRELNRREALKLYALGLLSERDSRYLD